MMVMAGRMGTRQRAKQYSFTILFNHTILWGRHCSYPHVIDKESEA